MINRRKFLAWMGAAGTSLVGLPGSVHSKNDNRLPMYGPPAAPSLVLAHIADTGGLNPRYGTVDFKVYRDPDQLRTGFVSGRWDLAGTPSYVAANMANRNLPVYLLNVMTIGLLYLVSRDGGVRHFEDLAGKTTGMFFKGDMPDLVCQYIAGRKNMRIGKDLRLQYVASPIEAIQLLLAGRIDHAVLPEPAATAAIMRGAQAGQKLHRAIDLQQTWAEATGGSAEIPQAGMMISQALLDRHPGIATNLQRAFTASAEWVNANHAKAASLGEDYMPMKAPVIQQSIGFSNIRSQTAKAARASLESFYERLAELNPGIIGNRLPDDGFYL